MHSAQHGIRSERSTVTALSELVDYVEGNRAEKIKTAGLLCDVSKAFDCISHDILLEKLKHYGVSDQARAWFRSYLSGRTMLVDIDGTWSASRMLPSGVPQGSILGPLLFIPPLYIKRFAPNLRPR